MMVEPRVDCATLCETDGYAERRRWFKQQLEAPSEAVHPPQAAAAAVDSDDDRWLSESHNLLGGDPTLRDAHEYARRRRWYHNQTAAATTRDGGAADDPDVVVMVKGHVQSAPLTVEAAGRFRALGLLVICTVRTSRCARVAFRLEHAIGRHGRGGSAECRRVTAKLAHGPGVRAGHMVQRRSRPAAASRGLERRAGHSLAALPRRERRLHGRPWRAMLSFCWHPLC